VVFLHRPRDDFVRQVPLEPDPIDQEHQLPDPTILIGLHTQSLSIEHLDPSILEPVDEMAIVVRGSLGCLVQIQAGIAAIDIGAAFRCIVEAMRCRGDEWCLCGIDGGHW